MNAKGLFSDVVKRVLCHKKLNETLNIYAYLQIISWPPINFFKAKPMTVSIHQFFFKLRKLWDYTDRKKLLDFNP